MDRAAETLGLSGPQLERWLLSVLERWRGATSSRDNRDSFGESSASSSQRFEPRPEPRHEPRPPEARTVEAPMLQPSMGLDPDRFSLLKKPLR